MNFTKWMVCSLTFSLSFLANWRTVRAQSSGPQPQFWISPSNALNYYNQLVPTPAIFNTDGVQTNGATADMPLFGDFDTILAAITNNVISFTNPAPEIHLFPGVYYTSGSRTSGTNGSTPLLSGFKIRGSGIDATILRNQFVPITLSQQGIIGAPAANFSCDNVEISDLSVDYGMPVNTNLVGSRWGIALGGAGCRVQRVKVTTIYGNQYYDSGGECFGIFIGSGNASTNSLIEQCEVSDTLGDYTSAILMSGSGVMRNNSIFLPVQSGNGYTYANAQHVTIIRNYMSGGEMGTWSDTGTANTNILVSANTFDNVDIAYENNVATSIQHWRDSYFVDNTVHNIKEEVWIGTADSATFSNLVVANNMFLPWDPTTTIGAGPINFGYDVSNIYVFRNAWPTNSSFWISGYDNVDLTGEIYNYPPTTDYTADQGNAVGTLPTLICSSNNWPSAPLTVWDTYTIVTSVCATNNGLELPLVSSYGQIRPGTQMTIAVMDPNAFVTLYPNGGQCFKVNGSILGSVLLYGTNPPATFISDNTGVWNQE